MSITNIEVTTEETNVEVTQVPANNLTVTQAAPLNIDLSLPGPQGAVGPPNVISVGTVTTGAAGSSAVITMGGTSPNQTINFTIPRGNTGATGPAPNLAIGTVANATAGQTATATITGTNPNYALNLNIPIANWTIASTTTLAPTAVATASLGGTALNPTLSLGIPAGAKWTSAAGAPAGASGAIGDWYVNTTTWDAYEKTAASTWTVRLNIRGATGQTGNTGATGPANVLNVGTVTQLSPVSSPTTSITGTSPTQTINFGIPAGAKILTGTAAPATGTGLQGDWFINTTTSDLYEKTAAAVWTLRSNIKGLKGDTGNTGATGPANQLAVGTVSASAPGSAPSVTIGGASPSQTISFVLPRGDTGPTGPAPNLTFGTVTTVTPGGSATATVTGTNPNYVLNLGIPRGDKGEIGAQWLTGTAAPAAGTGVLGDFYLVTGITGTGDVYKKTGASTWTLQGNIRGAAGAGNVNSVNAVLPDVNGNVVLTWGNFTGTIPEAALPAQAISDTFSVASQAAMLALTAQRGDYAIRTDEGATYILTAEPASTLANWTLFRVNASNITTGTLPMGVIPTGTTGTTVALGNHGHALTDANITGIIPDAQLPAPLRAAAYSITDWNNATSNGYYRSFNAANQPPFAGDGVGFVEAYDVNHLVQTVHRLESSAVGPEDNTDLYRRHRYAGTWTAWYKLQWSQAEQDARYAQIANTVLLTGAQTIAGIKTFSSAPVVPDASFTIAKTSGLQGALDGKAATSHNHDAGAITTGTIAIARIPTGSTGTTVALGNHLHTGVYEPLITAGTTAQYRRGDNTWATLDSTAVGAMPKTHSVTGAVEYRDILLWGANSAAGSNVGSLIIQTTLSVSSAEMFRLDIEGTEYSRGVFSGTLIAYMYPDAGGTIHSPEWINNGDLNVTIRLAKNASNNLVIIIDNPVGDWHYPRVRVSRAMGRGSAPASAFTGWTAVVGTDLTAFTSLLTVPKRDILSEMVTNTGNQTIAGIKTFSDIVSIDGNDHLTFGTTGLNPPSIGTRSAGTKIVLWDSMAVGSGDYSIGIDGNTLWNAVPGASEQFKWYGGAGLAATLTGTGNLTTVGTITAAGTGFWGPGANITGVMHTTGAETVAGDKTFSNSIIVGGDVRTTGWIKAGAAGAPTYPLHVTRVYDATVVNGTNYAKAAEIETANAPISAGVTDSGYRIGLAIQGYFTTAAFAGTLGSQYGIWSRVGANSTLPTGTITNSYGVYVENLDAANVTVANKYGIFQNNPTARNIFHGSVSVGHDTSSYASYKLDVQGASRFRGTVDVDGAFTVQNNINMTISSASQTGIYLNNSNTTATGYTTQTLINFSIGGDSVGALKTTNTLLTGLTTKALYLTTNGAYPLAFGTDNLPNPRMVIMPTTGYVGITTAAPISKFANTGSNYVGATGNGVELANGLTWRANGAGFATNIYNENTGASAHGLVVATAATAAAAHILSVESGGVSRFKVTADGAAAFSGTITASTGGVTGLAVVHTGSGGAAGITLRNTGTGDSPRLFFFRNNETTTGMGILRNASGLIITSGVTQDTTSGTTRVTFSETGDITATGGVASGGVLSVPGTSYQTFGAVGATAPTFTTRSAGTKIVLWEQVNATNVDYAIGITAASQWYSVPNATAHFFRWYGGTTNIMTLASEGNLSTTGTITAGGTGFIGAGAGITGVVKTTGDETIAGFKTFSSEIVLANGLAGNAARIGNDSRIVDIDTAHTMAIISTTNAAYGGLRLGSSYTITANAATATITGNSVFTGTGSAIKIENISPQMQFTDTDVAAAGKNYWLHVNSGQFYLLQDRTGNGSWESTYPFVVGTDGVVNFGLGTTSPSATTTATTNSLNLQRFVFTTAGQARPTGSKYVEWVGPVQPTNAIDGDTWVNTA